MADLMARALGAAALKRADPEREKQKRYNDMRLDDLRVAGAAVLKMPERFETFGPEIEELTMPCPLSWEKQIAEEVEQLCFEDLAAVVGYYHPELVLSGPAFRERMDELVRSSGVLSKIRLKYGWHDASKVVPSHSRHVLVWTNRGEYRAWYDHKFRCWRVRRDGLNITHWREQCGPENWPAAK